MDDPLHSLLRRQLRRHVGPVDAIPDQWRAFVEAVNQAYRQSDLDRLMIERSLDLSSDELSTANAQMRDAMAALQQAQLGLESRIAQALEDQRRLEDQLRQAQKMEAIGRLAGGVAHDFNNLLVVITGEAELLLDRELPAAATTAVREILAAADSAAGLTRQLLAFSRRQTLSPTVVDVNKLIEETSTLIARLIGEHIVLVVTADPEAGSVSADANQVQQVVLNLAANARDAMPDGGRLTITTGVETVAEGGGADGPLAPGTYAMVTVSDTGVGMEADVLSRVFEPFFTTKDQQHGTGLGLSSAYGIVKQSHGHIDVISAPGAGATFRIWLPQVPTPSPPPASEPSAAPAVTATASGVILVVEDQEPVRRALCARLTHAGYTVADFPDGPSALSAAPSMPRIDLLLTDLVMPAMSGRELAARLEQVRPSLKVVYMTGYVNDKEVQREVQEGRRTLLQKPFRADRLVDAVHRALKGEAM